MSIIDIIKEIAEKYDRQELINRFGDLDDRTYEAILWAETRFPFNTTGSNDPLVLEEDLRNQIIDFFESKTKIGQRQDEIIEKLRAKGEWP